MSTRMRAFAIAGTLGLLGSLMAVLPASAEAPLSEVRTVAESALPIPAAAATVAANGADFNPGYIIDDSKFFDGNAMSQSEIQSFLNARVPNCAPGYTCLRNYTETTRTIPGSPMCSTYQGGANESAATIIFKVQQACGVSAKAILVTLQKEQGLVTKSAPSAGAFRSAMGAGCPDTAPCDAEYYGFFNQVHYGAFLFKRYTQPPGTGPGTPYPTRFDQRYSVGAVSQILFHPNASCGTAPVYIANQATHSLYVYTPYQPNGAALSNLYGTGDGCSSYGNRNFWAYYTDWFGPTTGADQPIGRIDEISVGSGGITVRGWALDPNTSGSIDVEVSLNGGTPRIVRADGSRTDVAAAYPGMSAAKGFLTTIPAGDGEYSVCVTGRNVGVGANALIGCRTVEVHQQNPWGRVDVAQPTEVGALVSGWALDPNTTQPMWMHVYVDGVFWNGVRADRPRGDVRAAIAGAGPAHGYSFEVPLAAGAHTICGYGINEGVGTNTELFCRNISVPTRTPRGFLDEATPIDGGIAIRGWALDPSSSASTWLHVYVDGRFATGVLADRPRPDVGAAFPTSGDAHGFSSTIPTSGGSRTICVFALNVQSDKAADLGCRVVSVATVTPRGHLDEVVGGAGVISVRGWTFDPTSANTTWTHVYVDGRFAGGFAAEKPRPDVAGVHPIAGGNRGFEGSLSVDRGSHTVCVYGLPYASGQSIQLGCRTVNVN